MQFVTFRPKILLFFQGVPIQQFVGLRPKMYSLLLNDGSEKKTVKGVSKSVIKSQLKHFMYKDCLHNRTKYNHNMTLIRSDNHDLYCDKVNKTSLSMFLPVNLILPLVNIPFQHSSQFVYHAEGLIERDSLLRDSVSMTVYVNNIKYLTSRCQHCKKKDTQVFVRCSAIYIVIMYSGCSIDFVFYCNLPSYFFFNCSSS